MEKFCYWQEEPPMVSPILSNYKHYICLLRQSTYRLDKKHNGESKVSIFCPCNSPNETQQEECSLGVQLYEQQNSH